MADLKVYIGPGLSVPSRKVMAVLAAAQIRHEEVFVDLFKGEHMTEAYTALLPTGKVPAIRDAGLTVIESNAIGRYLATKYAPELYPSDPAVRAKVDMALDFMRGMEQHIGKVIMAGFLGPAMKGAAVDSEAIAAAVKDFSGDLTKMENTFWKGGKFLVGHSLTIADCMLYTLVQQMLLDESSLDISGLSKVTAWHNHLNQLESFSAVKKVNEYLTTHVQELRDMIAAKQ